MRARLLVTVLIGLGAAGAAFSTACSGDNGGTGGLGPPATVPTATGDWAGDYEVEVAPQVIFHRTLTLTLQQTGTSVTGTGAIAVTGDPDPYWTYNAVAGTHIHPAITLTLSSTGSPDNTLEGQFIDGSTIQAEMDTGMFNDVPITLKRQ